jgi:hypothetical protein
VAELYAVEYLTTAGWVGGHAGIALNDPERYVARAAARLDDPKAGEGAWARAVPLDGRLQPLRGEAVYAPGTPDFEGAPPSSTLALLRVVECAACGGPHDRAWGCLL